MIAVCIKFSILYKQILRELDNMKTLLYEFSVQFLVVKTACVNAAQVYKGVGRKVSREGNGKNMTEK